MTNVEEATEIGAVPCATVETNREAVVTPVKYPSPSTQSFDVGFVVPMPIARALRIFLLSSIIFSFKTLKAILVVLYSTVSCTCFFYLYLAKSWFQIFYFLF